MGIVSLKMFESLKISHCIDTPDNLFLLFNRGTVNRCGIDWASFAPSLQNIRKMLYSQANLNSFLFSQSAAGFFCMLEIVLLLAG